MSDMNDTTETKKGFFTRLKEGLSKSRDGFTSGFNAIFSGSSQIDEDFYDEIEEQLILGDVGIQTTDELLSSLRETVKQKHIKDPSECKGILIDSIRERMSLSEDAYDFADRKAVIMVIGVNGVGKTTSVGKLAGLFKQNGKSVLIAAADTFRAAASDQLTELANRAGVPIIGSTEGTDPASVVFDAVSAAKARNVDILIIDTAGRLHNKKNLMEELRKMNKIIDREYPECARETFIVLDGTTGQNALVQAKEFGDVTDLTGIVLTKMDGTAKGGIAIAIQSQLQVPVKFIGIGEKMDDLQRFNPQDFVNALFDLEESDE